MNYKTFVKIIQKLNLHDDSDICFNDEGLVFTDGDDVKQLKQDGTVHYIDPILGNRMMIIEE